MALATAKINWTAATATRSKTALMQILRDFMAANGWTIVDDMTAAADSGFVVTTDRGSGFASDNPLIWIRCYDNGTLYLYLYGVSSWNTATHTYGSLDNSYPNFLMSITQDMELIVSTDAAEGWLAATAKVAGVRQGTDQLIWAGCVERLAGDQHDTYPLWGTWKASETRYVYVTKAFNGSMGVAGYFADTLLGNGAVTLTSVNEAGNDVCFKFYAQNYPYGIHKGQLYGLMATTDSATGPADGTIATMPDGKQFYVVRAGNKALMFAYAAPTVYS